MNLSDLVSRVYACTDRNPNTTAYRSQVVNWLNDAYLRLCAQERWLFMQSKTTFNVYPSYTTGSVTVVNGSRQVVGAGTSWFSDMDGHYFVGPDGREYVIGSVGSTTVLYLTSDYQGTSGANQTYTIRFFAFAMPEDCIEPTNIVSRTDDRGRIRYIDTETEASYYMKQQVEGTPIYYFAAGTWNPRTLDYDPTAAAGGAGGTLVSGTTYYYRIATEYEGVKGAASNEVSFTATATGTIVLSGIQDYTTIPGMKKIIFRRTGTNRNYFRVAVLTHATTTYTDDGTNPELLEYPLKEFGQTLKVWFWPRPSVQKELTLWYMRRPRRLMKDNDVPDLPQEFHDVLWKLASVDILQKYNQPTATIEREIEEMLTSMRRRHLVRTDRDFRMGNAWEGRGRWFPNMGDASFT